MIKRIIQILFAPIGGALGYWIWSLIEVLIRDFKDSLWGWAIIFCEIAIVSAMAVIGYFVGKPVSLFVSNLLAKATKKAKEMPVSELFSITAGLLVGFLCAFLICQVFDKISNELLVTCINALVYICFGFLGARVAYLRHDEFKMLAKNKSSKDNGVSGGTVLDSSMLIDGRTTDIFKTGFIKEPIYIPQFVLEELTRLADSEDSKKRTRGRLGLDAVKKLQENENVIISDKDYSEIDSMDNKIINFAKEFDADIMTNDYSLNMVASVQGVKILNVNELVNALKSMVVAGDEFSLEILKAGKEPSQGVGYLDDGTMVVVENGSAYVDSIIEVVVTSILQTNAGKIIFAKVK